MLASIGATSFDGAQEGALKEAIESAFDWLIDAGLGRPRRCASPTRSSSPLSFAVVGLFFCPGFAACTRSAAALAGELGTGFAHAFIPIALAYLVAHYFSLFVFQEQAQFTYLLSDPLGDGSNDLFGTAGVGIDYTLISANAIWYVQVGALVIGHVAALVLGHDRALAIYGDSRVAARSQYWMLAVMVAFTCSASSCSPSNA